MLNPFVLRRRAGGDAPSPALDLAPPSGPAPDIASDDPLMAYLQSANGTIDLDALQLDSRATRALRAAGVKLVVPLVAQGELLGCLNLGARLSEQSYSSEDRRLLDDLAGYAAPAVRVAQLVHQQQVEVRERLRIEQELRVAALIQQQFLPTELPALSGWEVAAHYQPAREVGGDFYDFLELPGGAVGVVVGDVTDKGVPAALIMAKTTTVLRAEAPRLVAPGRVLARANQLLIDDMPCNMFVTCLYAVLQPATGTVRYANAGHPVPYLRRRDGVGELRASGMPLGLLPDMVYEERETVIAPGEQLLLHSDGVAEAHDGTTGMFGFARLAALIGTLPSGDGDTLIAGILAALGDFVGPGREQEDDITLVSLRRSPGEGIAPPVRRRETQVLTAFDLPSKLGNERVAMQRVAVAAQPLKLDARRLEGLQTAVSEAIMNAIEHGNQGNPALPVSVRMETSPDRVTVHITDRGSAGATLRDAELPDLQAKLQGLQTPRGWGLFLMRNLVDELHVSADGLSHTVELVVRRDPEHSDPGDQRG